VEHLIPAGWLPLAAFFAAALILLLLWWQTRRAIARLAATPDSLAAEFLEATRAPGVLFLLGAALATALEVTDFNPRQKLLAGRIISISLVASFTLITAQVLTRMAAAAGRRRHSAFGASGLSRTLIWVLVLGLGGLFILRTLGYNITPLLTTLGVGGLAVALALKDTLENFFAGLHLLLEEPIHVGNFIRLAGSGEEGEVADIGWRTTRLKTTDGNLIVIPNVKLTTASIINFSLPEPMMMAELVLVAAHDTDLAHMKRLALAAVARHPEVVKTVEPVFLADPGVTPTHLQAKVMVPVPSRLMRGMILSEIREGLLSDFRREGISFPEIELSAHPVDSKQ
jgi:small-conductance mechanosensitive channel